MLAVRQIKYLIADSEAIQHYLQAKYDKSAHFIPYGSDIPDTCNERILEQYKLKPYKYFLSIARIESENNIEAIIKGFLNADLSQEYTLVIVGNNRVPFGRYLQKKYPAENSRPTSSRWGGDG